MTELEKAARMREIKVCPYEYRCSVSDECYLCQWGGVSKQIRGAANKSFVLGAQWQAKQSPWISVEEYLPPDLHKNILLKVENAGVLVGLGLNVKETDLKITHWMLIPEVQYKTKNIER